MRNERMILCLVLVLALVAGSALGRQDAPAVVQTERVRGSVSVLYGQGGNIGVSAGADGLLMVDDQFERLAREIEAALVALAPATERAAPRFLVNTHHHGDHTDGNKHFGRAAVVVAHENVRARLLEEKAPPQALPVVTHADGLSLHWNGEEVRLLHVPGAHTDGDTVVWFTGSNVVHLGDLYFQIGYPFVDVASGGNVVGLVEGLRGVLAKLPDDVRLIPGHGVVTGKGELIEYVTMLETVLQRVREHLAAGRDVAAMMAAGVTQDLDERWGHFDFVPPRRFVESVVASLE
jgi:glyoxylase-like metal-dependent hydrolase (beta-lactamase superfamily II)